MGLPAAEAEGSPGDQFSFRRPNICKGPVSRAGIVLLRIHRHQIAKDKMAVHQSSRGLVLLRRPMASDAFGWGSVHAADNGTRAGCRADPRPANGDFGALGLVSM